jgi:hypothetical protein
VDLIGIRGEADVQLTGTRLPTWLPPASRLYINGKAMVKTMADWLVAIGTLVLAFVTVFQDYLRSKLWSPVLDCKINLHPPDCHKTTVVFDDRKGNVGSFDSYFFRFEIWNHGKVSAKNVEVLITEVLKKKGNSYELISSFSPDNLAWSTLSEAPGKFERYCTYISPTTYKHCNLGHIHDPHYRQVIGEDNPALNVHVPETIFCFDVIFRSTILYHLVGPGTYRIRIKVGCENAKTIERQYEITITGKWNPDEARMLNEGMTITEFQKSRATLE